MGKQINYYMGYKDFLSVAKAALDSGCKIYRHSFERGKWHLYEGADLDIIKEDCLQYYFYLPEAGKPNIKLKSGHQHIAFDSMPYVIEAGFSIADTKNRFINRNRLYLMTGQYADDGSWIARPDSLTKLYNKLVRAVKKAAPYTEVEYFAVNPMYDNKRKSKEYISGEFLELVQNVDYTLG